MEPDWFAEVMLSMKALILACIRELVNQLPCATPSFCMSKRLTINHIAVVYLGALTICSFTGLEIKPTACPCHGHVSVLLLAALCWMTDFAMHQRCKDFGWPSAEPFVILMDVVRTEIPQIRLSREFGCRMMIGFQSDGPFEMTIRARTLHVLRRHDWGHCCKCSFHKKSSLHNLLWLP